MLKVRLPDNRNTFARRRDFISLLDVYARCRVIITNTKPLSAIIYRFALLVLLIFRLKNVRIFCIILLNIFLSFIGMGVFFFVSLYFCFFAAIMIDQCMFLIPSIDFLEK